MGKKETQFVCQNCGHISLRWIGKCPSCGEWNSFVEEIKTSSKNLLVEDSALIKLSEIEEQSYERVSTFYKTLDKALGGGLVKGQAILISGEPGIGKSTLLLQISKALSKFGKIIYVSGEESSSQIYIRAKRVKALDENILIFNNTKVETIIEKVREVKPVCLIIDSIQTIYLESLESSPGSVSQVRESTFKIINEIKKLSIPTFIVGHINKEGSIAGPKVLEHMVDTVIQFEGERISFHRILRVIKNRYGEAGDLAVFKMTESGLIEIEEPSSFFLLERRENAIGSTIFPFTEGSKPVLLEIQALVLKALYTTPQRRAHGFDPNRLSLILGVLEKEGRIFTRDSDVYINVVGNIEINEPASDLAVAISVASSKKEKPVQEKTAIFGELGLGGEVRAVHYTELRIKELERFDIKRVILPKSSIKDINTNLELIGVSHILEAIDFALT